MSSIWSFLLPAIVATIPLYYALRYIWECFQLPNLHTRAVFITGCDSGFGRMLALRCSRNGILTFAGCFTAEGKAQIEVEAAQRGMLGKLIAVPLDVTSDESVEEAAKFVEANLPGNTKLWALVNNAGVFSCYGPDAWTPMEEYKASMEVNCWGCIRCTHAFLPLLKRSRGRIVSVSSVAGRVSIPCGAPYAVAKYGVEAYMDAIRFL